MKPEEHINLMSRTDLQTYESVRTRFSSATTEDLRTMHAAIGLCTEGGEFLDAVKKWIFYGKSLDHVNLKEEIGDLLWYISLYMASVGLSYEEAWAVNIAKLKARYPHKFSEQDALNRNLENERKILENKEI